MAVNIDLQERFPHLSRAPITEALLEVRARAQVPWNKDEISRKIIEKVPDYPATMPEHGIENRIDRNSSEWSFERLLQRSASGSEQTKIAAIWVLPQ